MNSQNSFIRENPSQRARARVRDQRSIQSNMNTTYRLDVLHGHLALAVLTGERRRLGDGDVVVAHVGQTDEVTGVNVVGNTILGGDAARTREKASNPCGGTITWLVACTTSSRRRSATGKTGNNANKKFSIV